MQKYTALTTIYMVFLLGFCAIAQACYSGEAIEPNRILAQLWGRIGLVLTAPVLCLQIWRKGRSTTTYALVLVLTILHLLNPGLHYYGYSGDCGYTEVSSAKLQAGILVAMLCYQLVAALYQFRQRRKAAACPPGDNLSR